MSIAYKSRQIWFSWNGIYLYSYLVTVLLFIISIHLYLLLNIDIYQIKPLSEGPDLNNMMNICINNFDYLSNLDDNNFNKWLKSFNTFKLKIIIPNYDYIPISPIENNTKISSPILSKTLFIFKLECECKSILEKEYKNLKNTICIWLNG